ncbi:MAG TPA: MarR family transcriptional regulator [Phycisphaerae bacterium]|nr:MarR family transcriptional regulator [Phycisphaerae bacterium]
MARSDVMALIGQSHLTWRRYLQSGLVKYGITLKQLYLLRQLAKREFLNPTKIAEMLYCDCPTATVVIGNMEKRSWLVRQKDPENRRRVRVQITPSGRDKLEEVITSAESASRAKVDPLACFSDNQVNELETLMRTLHEHLKISITQSEKQNNDNS